MSDEVSSREKMQREDVEELGKRQFQKWFAGAMWHKLPEEKKRDLRRQYSRNWGGERNV